MLHFLEEGYPIIRTLARRDGCVFLLLFHERDHWQEEEEDLEVNVYTYRGLAFYMTNCECPMNKTSILQRFYVSLPCDPVNDAHSKASAFAFVSKAIWSRSPAIRQRRRSIIRSVFGKRLPKDSHVPIVST
jgi:hypothetical protein